MVLLSGHQLMMTPEPALLNAHLPATTHRYLSSFPPPRPLTPSALLLAVYSAGSQGGIPFPAYTALALSGDDQRLL